VTTEQTSRRTLYWFAITASGVVLVFAGGFLTAGGSSRGLLLMAAGAVGFLAGRLSLLLGPRRRHTPHAGYAPAPPRRAGQRPNRQGRPPMPVQRRRTTEVTRDAVRRPASPRDRSGVG
jgi:hypothetical protein